MGSFPETLIDPKKQQHKRKKTLKLVVQMKKREKEVSLCKRNTGTILTLPNWAGPLPNPP